MTSQTIMGNVLLLLLAAVSCLAIGPERDLPESTNPRLAWWREARFGMFIRYGPLMLTGKEVNWSRANSNPTCPNHGPVKMDVADATTR